MPVNLVYSLRASNGLCLKLTNFSSQDDWLPIGLAKMNGLTAVVAAIALRFEVSGVHLRYAPLLLDCFPVGPLFFTLTLSLVRSIRT